MQAAGGTGRSPEGVQGCGPGAAQRSQSGPGSGPDHAAAGGHLLDLARTGTVTLLTAVKDPERSHVPVLIDHLKRQQQERHV